MKSCVAVAHRPICVRMGVAGQLSTAYTLYRISSSISSLLSSSRIAGRDTKKEDKYEVDVLKAGDLCRQLSKA